MTLLLCRVSGAAAAVREVIASADAEVPCRPVAVRAVDGIETNVLLSQDALDVVRGVRADVRIDVLYDVDAAAAAARDQVSAGGRFAARGDIPRGVGRKE